MKPLKQTFIPILLTLAVVVSQKNSDESRPYEFGFTIDGEQHRHEKKDQNGIVQGEFGFITADGVYHVTVYATDENGKFRILSMRNIRISAPLDGSPATGPISPEAGKYLGKQKQVGNSPAQPNRIQPQQALPSPQEHRQSGQSPRQDQQLSQQPLQGPQPPQSITQKPQLYEFTTQSTIKPACGGCGYVTTSKSINGQPFPFQTPAFQNGGSSNGGSANGGSENGGSANGGSANGGASLNGVENAQNVRSGSSDFAQPRFSTPNSVQNVQNVQDGSLGFVKPSVGNQYQQQNVPSNPQGFSQNTQTGGSLQQPPATSPVTSQYQNNQNQQHAQPPFGIPSQQQPFGQNGQSGGNLGILQGSDLLPPGTNQQYHDLNSQQGSRGQSPVNTQSYQNDNIPNEQEYGLFGSLNKGANGHIQSPATSGTAFVPNPLTHQGEEVSVLPPVSVSDNKIHVAGNKPIDIPIKDKYPGMVDGLPDGIEEKDIKDILYKFHYTVGFHGHYEKGLKNGAKIGGYFVNGRDGISRVVTYIADENGYRPKFKFINLGLESAETPKEGSEKQFGLKSFEFVWYPIE